MKFNSIESVRDFPPFLSDLIVQIKESKLLTNYANVLRLQKQLFECIVRYTAVIKLALIIKFDDNKTLAISKDIGKLRSPDFSLWLNFATCNLEGLESDEKCSHLIKSLREMNAKWIHASTHKQSRNHKSRRTNRQNDKRTKSQHDTRTHTLLLGQPYAGADQSERHISRHAAG